MTRSIDVNSDMGESFGVYRYGEDEAIVRSISSGNLACGFHASDPTVMAKTIALAHDHGVAVGAHFGYRDLVGFGRRNLSVRPSDLKNDVACQLGALGALAKAQGVTLHHAKAHGALYMMALEDNDLSLAIVEAVSEFDDSLMVYTVAGSATDRMARRKGLRVVPELFADRPYFADGQVKMFGWSLEEVGGSPEAIGERVRRLVTDGVLPSVDGQDITPTFETICIHSDTPGSPHIAEEVRKALTAGGVQVKAP